MNSGSSIASHMIRFGIHQYVTKKSSDKARKEEKIKGEEERSKKEKSSSKKRKKNTKENPEESENSRDIEVVKERGRTRGREKTGEEMENKEKYKGPVESEGPNLKQENQKKKSKHWWSKFIDRQKKKRKEQNVRIENSAPQVGRLDNYEYLLFGSGTRMLFIHGFEEDLSMVPPPEGNKMRPESYVPLHIKTSIFAAYFSVEPVLIHFSKTISRNRRVKYGQEIAVAEAYPRTVNNSLSNIILARCDGTISIINQTKGIPIQSRRMFLVITCNDTS